MELKINQGFYDQTKWTESTIILWLMADTVLLILTIFVVKSYNHENQVRETQLTKRQV